MEFTELDARIDAIEEEAASAANGRARWKDVWSSIKTIGASFRDVRYPTKDEKNAAWGRFQKIVEGVKSSQGKEQETREAQTTTSEQHRYYVIAHAESGLPSSDLVSNLIETGIEIGSLGFLRNDEKDDLMRWSRVMNEAWDYFTNHKHEILGRDKQEIFRRLRELQDQLDEAWKEWKAARQRAYEERQQHRETQRHASEERQWEWRGRVEENVRKLEDRLKNLYGIVGHKENHLTELEQKRADAWSDSFRERIEGWIEEEESTIADIKSQIEQVEMWLEESRTSI